MILAHIEREPLLAGRPDHQDRLTRANGISDHHGHDLRAMGGSIDQNFFSVGASTIVHFPTKCPTNESTPLSSAYRAT
jgi:hypothetical protein